MADLFFTDAGDIAISTTGDIALTQTNWREYAQQAYIILMTPVSDFALYPFLGTELERLIGMAQTRDTGAYGSELVKTALSRNQKFSNIPISVKSIPTGLQSIRFDIYITVGSRSELILSIEQNLGL